MVSHQMALSPEYMKMIKTYSIEDERRNDPYGSEDQDWYFSVVNELNATITVELGPYASFPLALAALNKLKRETREAEPSVIRKFTQPYQGSRWH